ncbi:PKD domain-containing protein [Tenacibaculum sp. nBUS_03]|uniref:PKD domain-containing protein n=1 Tax=Tenacibaculum sp. nBUS_03 TaxID=3395320 RepID=UPI003EBB2A61
MKKYGLLFYVMLFSIVLLAQKKIKNDTITRTAIIKYDMLGNELILTPQTPPLKQIAGGPPAFYSFYWEFGDGKYSKEKQPKHIYKKKGDYEVKLWVTNHYDTGKAPKTRPQKVSVKEVSQQSHDEATIDSDFALQKNRDPIPNEEIVLVMSYKNEKNYVSDGQLFLFFNEKKFEANNFELKDVRTYHGEETISDIEAIAYANESKDEDILYASLSEEMTAPSIVLQDSSRVDLQKTINSSKEKYRNWNAFKFNNMNPSEKRNIFFTLQSTPEMLKDTSAIISVRGVYVPDGNFKNHKVKEMEMEIVTSHDPNNMSSNGTFLNYRLVRYKKIKYKIRFQNNGERPANTIRLETDMPNMLDKKTLKVLDMYPKCEICPKEEVTYSCLDTSYTKEKAIFTFKNIYLPGSNQKGVKERDSTKGFVKYSVRFGKDFHKKKTVSRTAIFFDKNEPVITNRSTTRFLPGVSVGAKMGYNYFTTLKNSKDYFIGLTVSPYKSYRWYWQAELLNSFHSYYGNTTVQEDVTKISPDFEDVKRVTTSFKNNNINWTLPLLVRYNVNNYIGLGAGMQGTISLKEKQDRTILTEGFQRTPQGTRLVSSFSESKSIEKSFVNFRKGLLFEVTGGFSRIGPSLGARYVMDLSSNFNHWQFYAIWKF